MNIEKLSAEDCRSFVSRVSFGRLGCAQENQPYVVPLYFVWQGDRLYGFATLGRKIDYMRGNPRVCVEIDEVESHYSWTSVVIMGEYEEITEDPMYREEKEIAQKLLERRSLWWQPAYVAARLRERADGAAPVFFMIHIRDISGYRGTPDVSEKATGLDKKVRVRRLAN
jgi:uncharacterized protein